MKIKTLITTRWGGVSKAPYDTFNLALHVGDNTEDVQKNREILKQKTKLSQIQFANQIHSDKIVFIDALQDPPSCDGLITITPNLGLAVMSADCFGVLLYDEKGIIAALHAGRAGTTKKIVTKAIQQMKNLGARNIKAILSPGIHSCCYEVSEQMAQTYPKRFIKRNRYLDIAAMIYEQLKDGGVESIQDYNICTSCNHNYFSYRRDGQTGRFVSLIWMEES
ncbi:MULTISPECIES: peptidoglycan editing factor PgeF [unclassified Nitratiruptor]|uniref:peptidoglycan editing factor PgeF n=1 Tax=unclassified Nitratiruptor TaxID=2624044 RepID=UPI00191566EA|nr:MULTISPECIES: peptidoglycan editing factor PgeF [unclassified Nitratiruptor]BCD59333.1 polyphenol oxidase [Nitratiruptor sp. YY08-10]BCD63257.1 polyphenol oxidase [Nitratiruptor sp. YY08-14]